MRRAVATFFAISLITVAIGLMSCGEESDPLAPNVALAGKVTNNSGASGAVIVEIDSYLRCVANGTGGYQINIHRDFYVDSLYAWVDKDGNGKYNAGEPFGFYRVANNPSCARSFQVRDSDITNLNFSIP